MALIIIGFISLFSLRMQKTTQCDRYVMTFFKGPSGKATERYSSSLECFPFRLFVLLTAFPSCLRAPGFEVAVIRKDKAINILFRIIHQSSILRLYEKVLHHYEN